MIEVTGETFPPCNSFGEQHEAYSVDCIAFFVKEFCSMFLGHMEEPNHNKPEIKHYLDNNGKELYLILEYHDYARRRPNGEPGIIEINVGEIFSRGRGEKCHGSKACWHVN